MELSAREVFSTWILVLGHVNKKFISWKCSVPESWCWEGVHISSQEKSIVFEEVCSRAYQTLLAVHVSANEYLRVLQKAKARENKQESRFHNSKHWKSCFLSRNIKSLSSIVWNILSLVKTRVPVCNPDIRSVEALTYEEFNPLGFYFYFSFIFNCLTV